jgi:DNA polymerase-4
VDLAAGDLPDSSVESVSDVGRALKAAVQEVTGGLTASVGIGTSKLIAKIASDLDKPDGLVVVPPGTEAELIGPMPVRTIPGIGPATAERLRRVGVTTVAQLRGVSSAELVRLVGQAHGTALHALSRAEDDRPVVAEREAKSISVEDTYDADLVERRLLEGLLSRQAEKVAERLRKARLSGRTVTVKVRLHDFTTHSRSSTLPSPTDDAATLARVARRLLADVDTRDGVRLLGVGVSGLADWIQEDLFDLSLLNPPPERPEEAAAVSSEDPVPEAPPAGPRWAPGMDVEHDEHGPGWVWGSGVGRVTVRFETARTGPGPVRTFAAADPALRAIRPLDED